MGANDAYEEALKLDPANAQAKSGLAAVQRAIESEAAADGADGGGLGGLGNMFNDPNMIQKLASNPKTSSLLADPSFMAKLQKLKQNPNSIGEEMRDPRFLQVMSVLLGIDMSFGGAADAAGEAAGVNNPRDVEEDIPMPDARPSSAKPSEPARAQEPAPEPEPEDEEALAKKKAKEEADTEKKHGTENYKKRQFDAAIEHYSKAWDLHKDITYLTNLSAAQFEKGAYEDAITTCEKAIEEGREVLADFKIIAKYVGLDGNLVFHDADNHQGIRSDWYFVREAWRSAKGHRQLSKVPHRTPHSRDPQQTASGGEGSDQGGEGGLYQPRGSRQGSRTRQPEIQGSGLAWCRRGLQRDDETRTR